MSSENLTEVNEEDDDFDGENHDENNTTHESS